MSKIATTAAPSENAENVAKTGTVAKRGLRETVLAPFRDSIKLYLNHF